MPIPPRPIPTPAPRRAHTSSTAAKPGSSLPRRGLHFMDHADIFDLPLPSSLPVKGLSGVTVVKHKPEVKVQEGRKMEVGVNELVMDGLGKREKRATTATSLGFDFIQNPSVLALPEQEPARSKLSPSPLGQTPTTPALEPTGTNEPEVDEDEDWEHISGFGQGDQGGAAEVGTDEGDIILLGEMELDEAIDKHPTVKGKQGMRAGKTYAAVVGTTA